MGSSDGRDLIFAAAGVLWGAVTVFRGVQSRRQAQRRLRSQGSCAIGAWPLDHYENAALLLIGGALALGCVAYLVCSLLPL
jgi:hypothetical protein